MRLRVVPIQLFTSTPYLVTIALNRKRSDFPTQTLIYVQAITVGKMNFTGQLGKITAALGNDKGRAQNSREVVRKRVNIALIVTQ